MAERESVATVADAISQMAAFTCSDTQKVSCRQSAFSWGVKREVGFTTGTNCNGSFTLILSLNTDVIFNGFANWLKVLAMLCLKMETTDSLDEKSG